MVKFDALNRLGYSRQCSVKLSSISLVREAHKTFFNLIAAVVVLTVFVQDSKRSNQTLDETICSWIRPYCTFW